MRIYLIVNPLAGKSRAGAARPAAVPAILRCLGAWCPEVVVRETDCRGAGERIAREIGPGEYDLVVAAGGDGTINEVVNGFGEQTPLGIVPLGTVNVLARELQIPINDISGACEVLRTCRPRPIDLGDCSGRRFSLMAGIGFDAAAVRDVPPNVKDLIGAPAYVLSGLRVLTGLRRPLRYRIHFAGHRLVTRGMLLVVANASSYAGPLQIAPLATIDDGWLDLCLFRERSKLAFLGQLVRVLLRRHLQHPQIVYYRAKELRVECEPPAAVQLDGDYFGRTPVTIKILPQALRVIRPG